MTTLQQVKTKSATANPITETRMPKPLRLDGQDLEMQVGARLHIELLTTGERFWGELTGDKQGKFLLVWLPGFSKYRKSLASETMVAVRAMNKDYQLCGFRTTIARLLSSPFPLLFLDYPDTYEKLSLRRHQRVDCLLPGLLLFNGEEYKCMITNISAGGAGIVLNSPELALEQLPEDTELFLMFKSSDGENEAVVRGLLRNHSLKDDKIQLGVKFDNLIGSARQIIEEYLSNLKQFNAVH